MPSSFRRIAWLAALFALELAALTFWLDDSSLNRGNVVIAWMAQWGASVLRSAVAFAALFAVMGYLRAKGEWARILREAGDRLIDWRYLAGHIIVLAAIAELARSLYQGSTSGVLAAAWIVAGLLAILLAALGFVPWRLWRPLTRSTGNVWLYALSAAVVAGFFGVVMRALWTPAARATFILVKLILSPVLPHFSGDPATLIVGTPAFQVEIQPACSGLEGMGLVLVFGLVWLWLFRGDLRFPQALFLVPMGVVVAFFLNSVRIAVLIWIGNAGAPGVALGGFHSQAGWIAFNIVALTLTAGAGRIPGIMRETQAVERAPGRDATGVYLLPFLAILAAGMISRSLSAGFEWLYPLRVVAASVVLCWNREQYRKLNWRFGWLGIGVGASVFGLWIALDRVTAGSTGAVALAAQGPLWIAWVVLRTAGAIVTVPVAEELAFRGYLMRRLASPDFEHADFRSAPLWTVLASSLAFGCMHGAQWIAGTIAGFTYAFALRKRGRIGEAVAAHACTNALLAAWVIARGEWRLW